MTTDAGSKVTSETSLIKRLSNETDNYLRNERDN